MSVLVYTESEGGKFKKIAQELASYAFEIAQKLGTTVTAVSINANFNEALGNYGVSKVVAINNDNLTTFNAQSYAQALHQVAQKEGSQIVILSSSANSKFLAPLLSVALDAGYVPNVTGVPESESPFVIKHSVFTNKAFSLTEIKTKNKIIGLSKNAFGVKENTTTATVENFSPEINASNVTINTNNDTSSKVTIADAEIVVSAGRGLKGPENWGLIENLAETLGAATACSKPVSDMGWRPHSEHVGQTGKPVASNLYIAIGISGAIQHLAGINSSKVKVVINNDPEAPFFKAADYGIVGDAFEVIPQLTEKLKAFKAANS